ncbi:MAG: histidine phosphatase family protein [Patescibacteria group bacterium]
MNQEIATELESVQSPFCRFYVVRHGESKANLEGYIAGHLDARLTSVGKQQAKERAKDLSEIHFEEAFASDLLRAHQTAKILSTQHKLIVKTTQAIRERSYGKYEGTHYEEFNGIMKELLQEYEGLLEEEQRKHRLGGEIESDYEIFQRLALFLRELAVTYPGKNILIVCHGGIMREFLIQIGLGNRQEFGPGAVLNLGYFVVDSDATEFFLKKTEGIEKGQQRVK